LATFPTFEHAGLAIVLLSAAILCAAQDELTLPPRITDAVRPETRLALPVNADREQSMEEVLVVRENPWRLPTLGREWRAREAAKPDTSRISTDFLPLYDPEVEAPFARDFFPVNTEMQRVGFFELFRVRFGER